MQALSSGGIHARMRPVKFALVLTIAAIPVSAASSPEPVAVAGVHNAFRLSPRLISGSAPKVADAFGALAKIGIKTIVSVDGIKPEVEEAARHSIRYIHLPIGYNGFSESRAAELAKAVESAEGPVFLHCHHGRHRAPAAAAAVCRALDGWTPDDATAFLKTAGTSPDFAGLYRDARGVRVPTDKERAAMPARFPAISTTLPMVDRMVAIDERFDTLQTLRAAGWKNATPEIAVLLLEDFRELQRTLPEKATVDFRRHLAGSEEDAALLAKQIGLHDFPAATASMGRISESCTQCHKAHRN